ncbi:hypothetical protein GAY28_32510 [Azospirillum brasilense]|nr:hypothetical protein [Azospirillum brasilense]
MKTFTIRAATFVAIRANGFRSWVENTVEAREAAEKANAYWGSKVRDDETRTGWGFWVGDHLVDIFASVEDATRHAQSVAKSDDVIQVEGDTSDAPAAVTSSASTPAPPSA